MRRIPVLLAMLILAFGFTAEADPTRLTTSSETLVQLSGQVRFAPAGENSWTPAKVNQRLKAGDRLRTEKKSRAMLRLPNGKLIEVPEDTVYLVRGT